MKGMPKQEKIIIRTPFPTDDEFVKILGISPKRRAELERLTADEDGRVIGVQRSTADRNGDHLDVLNCIVFHVEDGRVTDGREHFQDLYAWDEFWS